MDDDVKIYKVKKTENDYYTHVYEMCVKELTYEQRVLFDDWWYKRKPVPSDECFWSRTPVPEGYKHLEPYDIKRAHDSILLACSLGCG